MDNQDSENYWESDTQMTLISKEEKKQRICSYCTTPELLYGIPIEAIYDVFERFIEAKNYPDAFPEIDFDKTDDELEEEDE